ncbi:MAG: hprK [Alphaproteobacteria bacterium]|nr:hprK [Alphaproteobacteria bacterium]MDB5739049.1 hprK [Alphaproteobacteria bacterium]
MPSSEPKGSETNIHATCVALGARGVLLLGPSGAGKSDVALRLIDGGAKLVADDRTILFAARGTLHAKAPPTIAGLLEIRGVGIVKLPVRARVKIALVVRLGRENARLPEPQFYRALGTQTPQIALDGRFASTPARIRAALAFAQAGFRDTFHLH